MAAEATALYNAPKNAKEYQQQIKKLEQQMYKFAQDLEFEKAAAVRDQLHCGCVNNFFLIIQRNASLSWRSVYLFSPEEYKSDFMSK